MSAGVSLCLIWILYGYSWRSIFKILWNNTHWRPSSWECLRRGHFWTPSDIISHCIYIVRTSCCQFPARSGIFCLLVEVYKPCDLKFVYPTVNLAFMGIIVKVKLPAKFCRHSFKWFSFQRSSDANYIFLSCPRHCDRGLIVVIVYYFQIWNRKEYNIIISRVISSHMGPIILTHPILAVTWVPFPCILRHPILAITWVLCILRHPISSHMGPMYIETLYISSHMDTMYIETLGIYTFTGWAEIIEQSHGPHVYRDTLY